MSLRDRLASLLGISAYQLPSDVDTDALGRDEDMRKLMGGQLQPLAQSQTRWYLSDVESAQLLADRGDLSLAARLMRAARSDGTYCGVLSTRTDGLVRLPKVFAGPDDIVEHLTKGRQPVRSIFDEMCPSAELAMLAADGIQLGVGIAELVPVRNRRHPILVRLSPEFLRYRWAENRWYFQSVGGLLPITPGDGRWVLHTPGGRQEPWNAGVWRAVGKAYVRKDHAALHKDNWEAKLANPARVAVAPQGSTEEQQQSWFRAVMAWASNTVFGMKPGYDVKLLESNGRGYESFIKTIAEQTQEMIIAIAGQTVTTDGGAGFQNSDIHKSIRADLIKATADGLSYTINTQVLPSYVVREWGEDRIYDTPALEWDVTPPKDRATAAAGMSAAAQALRELTRALAQHGARLDVAKAAEHFGIPIRGGVDPDRGPLLFDVDLEAALDLARHHGMRPTRQAVLAIVEGSGVALEPTPSGEAQPRRIELAPTDVAKVVRVIEARAAQGLDPFGDERDDMTITEFAEGTRANAEIAVDAADDEAEADLPEAAE